MGKASAAPTDRKAFDRSRAEPIARLLQSLRVAERAESVVQSFINNSSFPNWPLAHSWPFSQSQIG
jgi:hypothetical protein